MPATPYDAQLHILRSVARLAADDQRQRQEIESARANLYSALAGNAPDVARPWARALRVALEVLRSDLDIAADRVSITTALAALGEIEAGLARPRGE